MPRCFAPPARTSRGPTGPGAARRSPRLVSRQRSRVDALLREDFVSFRPVRGSPTYTLLTRRRRGGAKHATLHLHLCSVAGGRLGTYPRVTVISAVPEPLRTEQCNDRPHRLGLCGQPHP